jgi:hypothetical protein
MKKKKNKNPRGTGHRTFRECYKKRLEILCYLKAYGERDMHDIRSYIGELNLAQFMKSLEVTGNVEKISIPGRGFITYKFIKFYE